MGCIRGRRGDGPSRLPRREQSVLKGVLDLLAGLLQVALGLVALALGLQFLVIGGPAEPLFGLPLDLLGLVLGLVIDAHGLVSWSSGPLLLPGIRTTKPRQGNPGSSRRLAFIGMAWDGWSVPPQRCAGGRIMVWYLVRSLDPELRVAVGWEPVLGSFIGRVEGVPTGALLDPDRPTVAWFGSRQGSCRQSRISRTPSATMPSSAASCGPPWRRIGSAGPMSWSRQPPWARWALLVPGSCPVLSSWGCRNLPPGGRCWSWP